MKLGLALLVGMTPACLAVNLDCPRDRTTIVGELATTLDLSPEIVGSREAAVGNLVADAMWTRFAVTDDADAALVDARSISDRTPCGSRDVIEPGALSLAMLVDLLPADDDAVVVELSGVTLRALLEFGVRDLALPGQAPTGDFMQVSGLAFGVRCPGTAPRVVEGLRVGGQPIVDSQRYRVVMPRSLAEFTRAQSSGDALTLQSNAAPRALALVLVDYVEAARLVRPVQDGRIILEPSCSPRLD